MAGLAPFVDDIGHLARRDCRAVHGPDDQVVRGPVGHGSVPVGVDALVEISETVSELPNGPGGELPEVAIGETGVFAADLHLPGEGQIIAREHRCACHESGREGLVGQVGLVKIDFAPRTAGESVFTGTILANGEIWRATSDEAVLKGERVMIEDVDGFILQVKRLTSPKEQ